MVTLFLRSISPARTLFGSPLTGLLQYRFPGEAAFLTFTENRYVPIPGSSYARDKSAALCYGASMYRPSKNPGVSTLRRGAE